MTWDFVVRRGLRQVRRRPWTAVALVGAFALLAVVVGGVSIAMRLADEALPRVTEHVHVIVYLKDDMEEERADALVGLLERIPGVRGAARVSPADAQARLRASVAELQGASALVDGIEAGFLPRSIEVALEPSAQVSARARDLATRLRRIAGVAEVDAMEDGLERLRSFLALVRVLGLGLAALALLLGVAVVGLAVVRGRQARSEEGAVLALLGETSLGIRLPGALLGAVTACAGLAVGLGVLFALHRTALAALRDVAGGWLAVAPRFLDAREWVLGIVVFVVTGLLVGLRSTPVPGVR